MTKQQLDQAIEQVAKATNTTKQEVAKKLMMKDSWTHFLVSDCVK